MPGCVGLVGVDLVALSHAPILVRPTAARVEGDRPSELGQRLADALTAVDAAAEEGPLQRILAVHAAATEPGDFTGGVQTGQHRTVGMQAAARQVGLDTAEGLAGQDPQPYGDQRAVLRVQDLVWSRRPDDLVAEEVAGRPDVVDLGVLGELVVELAVTVLDLGSQMPGIDQRRAGPIARVS